MALVSGALNNSNPSPGCCCTRLGVSRGVARSFGNRQSRGKRAWKLHASAVVENLEIGSVLVPCVAVGVAAVALLGHGAQAAEAGVDLPVSYVPDEIAGFFSKRPLAVVLRSVSVFVKCSALLSSILVDKLVGAKQRDKLRAAELVSTITSLGPTAIKIGQALSIRPDIVPVAYLEELQKLQDRVPPFSNHQARAIIREELGKPVESFCKLSEEPVAAASLGQVYKAELVENGNIVAVKVQRPGVVQAVALDLFIMRNGARLLQFLPGVHSDLVALVDNWALRFYDELDYVKEARNAQRFAADMRSLRNVIVPQVYLQYTSRKVLTTEWIEGEKLSESKAEDLLQLVTVALNCYLIQLLESGFLHADPHPGNLLRTPDGRLCVLDYGLMTEVTQDKRYALMDYISHLVNADYSRVADDLVALGFVPPDQMVDHPNKTDVLVPQLSRVLGQLAQGGGARKLNFQQITEDLASMSRDYVFVIPPYFALILRAFSVLEGIGLDADPDYSMVDECYPYLSKRLLTDDNPRARATLNYLLYAGKGQLDVDRVEAVLSAFQAFRKGMKAPVTTVTSSRLELDSATKDALLLVFAPQGSYLQEIILTELVRAVDALSRDAVVALWRYFAMRIPSWPLGGGGPLVNLSEEDEQTLRVVRRLWTLLEENAISNTVTTTRTPTGLRGIAPLMASLFPGVTTAAHRFLVMLLQRQALRLADDLDGRNSVAQWNKDPAAAARRIKPFLYPAPGKEQH